MPISGSPKLYRKLVGLNLIWEIEHQYGMGHEFNDIYMRKFIQHNSQMSPSLISNVSSLENTNKFSLKNYFI